MTTAPEKAITIAIPYSLLEVQALQLEAEAEAAAYIEFTIENAAEYAAVDAALSDVVRRKDQALAMRKSVLAPLEGVAKTIREWFAPWLRALETTETRYKGTMGAYELERRRLEREAFERAADAADRGEPVVEALTQAAEFGTRVGRATSRVVWRVERIIREMLPAEYLIPDEKAIAKVAREHTGDDPPVIPGVVFKQDVQIGARR